MLRDSFDPPFKGRYGVRKDHEISSQAKTLYNSYRGINGFKVCYVPTHNSLGYCSDQLGNSKTRKEQDVGVYPDSIWRIPKM